MEHIKLNNQFKEAERSMRVGWFNWREKFSWLPDAQNRLYTHVDEIYKECREKYPKEEFARYAFEHKLNKKYYEKPIVYDEELVLEVLCNRELGKLP